MTDRRPDRPDRRSARSMAEPTRPPVDPAGSRADEAELHRQPVRLVWRAFRRHRLAMVGAVVVAAVLSGRAVRRVPGAVRHRRASTTTTRTRRRNGCTSIDTSAAVAELGLYVYGYTAKMDPESLAMQLHRSTRSVKIPLRLFDTVGRARTGCGA